MLRKILKKIPIYNRYVQQNLDKQSKFYEQNRIKVLITYRHLLKYIPKIYPRTLQQAQKVNVHNDHNIYVGNAMDFPKQ